MSKLATPTQVEGPFYPVSYKPRVNNTLILNHHGISVERIIIAGHVRDIEAKPLAGIMLEIWQADERGRYDHPDDSNADKPLNDHFQYWGKAISDQQGCYHFHTIKPAPYNDEGEWRTPHIHFKLYSKRHDCILTTQMYFLGEALNSEDNHLSSLSQDEQSLLLTKPSMLGAKYGFDVDTQIHEFNIVLNNEV